MRQIFSGKVDKLGAVFNGVGGKFVTIVIVVALSALPIWRAKSSADLAGTWAMLLALLPAALIALYGGVACVFVKKTGSLAAESIADFTYFLGYLCTITALAVLVACMGYRKDGFVDIKTITLAIGMKLTATIVGLIFMILIKEVHSVYPLTSQVTQEVVGRLEDVITNSRDAFANLCQECKLAGTTLSEMRGQAKEFTQTITECNAAIGGGKTKLDEYATATGQCVRQMESLLDSLKGLSKHELPHNLVDLLGRTITGVHTLDEQCKAAGKSVQVLGTSVETCTRTVTSLSSEASANEQQMKKNEQQMGEVAAQLGRYADAVGLCLQQMDSLLGSLKRLSAHELPHDLVELLGKTIKGVHTLDAQCKLAERSVQELGASVGTCTKNVLSLSSEASTNEQEMKKFTAQLGGYADAVGLCLQQMDSLLGSLKKLGAHELPHNLVDLLGKTITGVHTLEAQCRSAEKYVQELGMQAGACTKNVASMNSEMSTNEQEIKKFNRAVNDLSKVLGQFVQLMELRIDRTMKTPN